MAARRSKKPKTGAVIDFGNINKGFESGELYAVEIVSAKMGEGKMGDYYSFEFQGLESPHDKNSIYGNFSTSEKSVWRLVTLMETLGMDIPESAAELPAEDFVGHTCIIEVGEGKDQDGKPRPEIHNYLELDDSDLDDDKPKKKKKKDKKKKDKKGKKKKGPKPISASDVMDMDDDELIAAAEAAGIEDYDISRMRAMNKKRDKLIKAARARDLLVE